MRRGVVVTAANAPAVPSAASPLASGIGVSAVEMVISE